MAHFLLSLYLLAALLGRTGLTLCEEGDSRLALETWFQTCCEQNSAEHEGTPLHADEATGVPCQDECPCVDRQADLLLAHRPVSGRQPSAPPQATACPWPQAACSPDAQWAALPTERIRLATCRTDLPGAGCTPRILRT